MIDRYDPSVLRMQVHHDRSSSIPSMPVLFAVGALALGLGVFLALPEHSDLEPQAASASAGVPETTGSTATAADELLCDKQAWPYIDQRCAQRVEAARGTRQVRIVTDKGNSVTVQTPQPIVEPKPKPAPSTPVVAQTDRPIGPPAAPMANSPPQVEKVAATPQQPCFRKILRQHAGFRPRNAASVAPAAASTAPVTAGYDAFADSPKKSKAAEKAERRAAEKAARREAKRQRAPEEDNGNAPEDVVATVKSGDGQNSRRTHNAAPDRARNAVPDEVLAEVERATAGELRGRRSREAVTVGSSRGGGTRVSGSE